MNAIFPSHLAAFFFFPIFCGVALGVPPFRVAPPGLIPEAPLAIPLFPAKLARASVAFRTGAALPSSPVPVEAPVAKPSETSSRATLTQRPAETPLVLQRRADRNLSPSGEAVPFTLRTQSGDAVIAQASFGLQTQVRYNDNLTNVENEHAIGEGIVEITPIVRFNLGTPPGTRLEKSLDTEYYAQVQYLPTIHALMGEGTSRTLQRLSAELGRANPILFTAVRFEHDENIFGAQGDNSAEESYVLTQLSPIIVYNMCAKTALRAQGFHRRISQDDPISNRTEYVLDAGIDVAASVKTSVGAGSEIGHIRFDVPEFGTQDYQQVYLSAAWRPSVKVSFQTRAGVELRQFERLVPKRDRVSPVVAATLSCVPDTATRINVGLRVHNEPSVSQSGALLQEVRLGADIRREFGWNLYARGEAALVWRDYDTKLQQRETTLRPALGYHTELGRIFDSLNIELFYQFRHGESNVPHASYDRNIFGIETTVFF